MRGLADLPFQKRELLRFWAGTTPGVPSIGQNAANYSFKQNANILEITEPFRAL